MLLFGHISTIWLLLSDNSTNSKSSSSVWVKFQKQKVICVWFRLRVVQFHHNLVISAQIWFGKPNRLSFGATSTVTLSSSETTLKTKVKILQLIFQKCCSGSVIQTQIDSFLIQSSRSNLKVVSHSRYMYSLLIFHVWTVGLSWSTCDRHHSCVIDIIHQCLLRWLMCTDVRQGFSRRVFTWILCFT